MALVKGDALVVLTVGVSVSAGLMTGCAGLAPAPGIEFSTAHMASLSRGIVPDAPAPPANL